MANNFLRLNLLSGLTKWPTCLSKSNSVNYSKKPKSHSTDPVPNENKSNAFHYNRESIQNKKRAQAAQLQIKKLSNQYQGNVEIINKKISKHTKQAQYISNISNAFREENIEHGFQLFQEFIQTGQFPNSDVFLAYWNYCHQANNLKDNVIRMLDFIEVNNVVLSRESVNGLILLLEQRDIAVGKVEINAR